MTKSPATLQFSYVGMKTIDKQVTASTRINLTMENDAQMVDEVVVVGYGTMKKRDVTGAITSISSEAIEQRRWLPMFLKHCKVLLPVYR